MLIPFKRVLEPKHTKINNIEKTRTNNVIILLKREQNFQENREQLQNKILPKANQTIFLIRSYCHLFLLFSQLLNVGCILSNMFSIVRFGFIWEF